MRNGIAPIALILEILVLGFVVVGVFVAVGGTSEQGDDGETAQQEENGDGQGEEEGEDEEDEEDEDEDEDTDTGDGTPPTIRTVGAAKARTDGTVLKADLSSLGSATSVDVWFEWGSTAEYGKVSQRRTVEAPTSTLPITVSGELQAEEQYHFRAVARSDAGSSTGEDMWFKTPPQECVNMAQEQYFSIETDRSGTPRFTRDLVMEPYYTGNGGVQCVTLSVKSDGVTTIEGELDTNAGTIVFPLEKAAEDRDVSLWRGLWNVRGFTTDKSHYRMELTATGAGTEQMDVFTANAMCVNSDS